MPVIVLMDNVLTASGSMVSGCESRLLKYKGVQCVVDGGRDSSGALLSVLEDMADRLVNLVRRNAADGVVMDIDWGANVSFDGFQIWELAVCRGLSLPTNRVVFVTQSRKLASVLPAADALGVDRAQVQFKNEQGNDAAAGWLANVIGLKKA